MDLKGRTVTSQPHRVLFPFTNDKIGGSHISAFTLGRALRAEFGVEVVVVAPEGSLILEAARDHGIAVEPLAERPVVRHNPLREAALFPRRLAQMQRFGKGSVLHSNGLSSLQSWGPAAKLAGLPVVYHNRALNRNILPNRLVMALADRIICISQSVADHVPAGLRARSGIIDNPFAIERPRDVAGLRAAQFGRWGIADDGPLIGFIGNFASRKRPRYFLEMGRDLATILPNAKFVLFGRAVDESEDDLKAHAQALGMADRVIWGGFQLPVENNIAILDLLAVPALNEPLGRTPLEALMLGVPYVVTDDAGLGETARRFGGGVAVPRSATAAEFAAVAAQVLANPGGLEMEQSAERATRQLSASAHASAVMDLYRGLFRS